MSQVRLIAFTQPIELEGVQTGEELVAYCARVSNPANQANHETAPRLLNYLVRNQHWSPFEMAHAVIEIQTTRDIARQILRHRSFSFQEFSQRYAEVTDAAVIREARLQDTANRQNSLDVGEENFALSDWWQRQQELLADAASNIYNEALLQGIAKEVARAVLPEGLTPSRLYMSGSVRSWIHYIQLRAGNGTQKEHREIAVMCNWPCFTSCLPSRRFSMRRSRYLYTWIDWAKEILGWGLGLVIGVILLPVLGFFLKLLWVFFMIGWDLIK